MPDMKDDAGLNDTRLADPDAKAPFQYSLRTLFLVTTVFAILMGLGVCYRDLTSREKPTPRLSMVNTGVIEPHDYWDDCIGSA